VRSSVIGILAQRLVRLLCSECASRTRRANLELKQIGLDPSGSRGEGRAGCRRSTSRRASTTCRPASSASRPSRFYRAKGCPACLSTGYVGRRGIYELSHGRRRGRLAHLAELGRAEPQASGGGARHGHVRDDGARKVLLGLTTVERSSRQRKKDVVVE